LALNNGMAQQVLELLKPAASPPPQVRPLTAHIAAAPERLDGVSGNHAAVLAKGASRQCHAAGDVV